ALHSKQAAAGHGCCAMTTSLSCRTSEHTPLSSQHHCGFKTFLSLNHYNFTSILTKSQFFCILFPANNKICFAATLSLVSLASRGCSPTGTIKILDAIQSTASWASEVITT